METASKGWEPRTLEGRMIAEYWATVGGAIYLEVPLVLRGGGVWPTGSRPRRIDAIIIPDLPLGRRRRQDLAGDLQGRTVHIVEAKHGLNRMVVGQIVVAEAMLDQHYPGHGDIVKVAVVGHADPAMEWACERIGIRVFRCGAA